MKKGNIKKFFKGTSFCLFWLFVGILIGIFVLSYVQGWFNQLINDLSFATGMMAIATFFLAFITYWNIHSRNAQEQRDRKERYLNEIIGWVIQVNKFCIPPSGIGKEAYKQWCRDITSSLASEGKWALRSSSIFGSEFNNNMNTLLGRIINLNNSIKEIGESNKYSDKQAQELLSKHFVLTLEATDEVLDRALKIRSGEKL